MSTAAANLPDLIQLPADLLAKAVEIPGLPDRLLRFIRLEVAMDEQRQQRHSPQALALVQRARERVVKRQEAGTERSEAMRDFHANYAAIVEAL
jgi:hypothetical protein